VRPARKRTSEFAKPSKQQSMTIIDRLLRACATGRGCRVLASSADALNLLFEHAWGVIGTVGSSEEKKEAAKEPLRRPQGSNERYLNARQRHHLLLGSQSQRPENFSPG
jgi:hypothetical protein